MTTPTNRFGRQISAYLANRLVDVGITGDGEDIDAVISVRYPAFLVPHPHHRLWLTHLMREYYDLWDGYKATLPRRSLLKETVRRAIIQAWDARALARLDRRFVISKTVQGRLRRFLDIPCEVLYPPPQPRPYRTDGYEDFILAPSRLHPLKRQDLLLLALPRLPRSTRAVIVGTGSDRERLERLGRDLGVADRVTFTGFASEETLLDLYARCRAVFFAPKDEDYGFITLEAFRSRKPVLTCEDSGGPTELVASDRSGFVVPPDALSIAGALERLVLDEGLCRRLGEGGFEATRGITWEAAIETLLS
ncbi:MAG: glycosyltransferase [Acidobacteriota bacterium]